MNLFPEPTIYPVSDQFENILIVCLYDPSNATQYTQNLACLQKKSCYSITILNLFLHIDKKSNKLNLNTIFNLDAFDGIIIDESVFVETKNLCYLNKFFEKMVVTSVGFKSILLMLHNSDKSGLCYHLTHEYNSTSSEAHRSSSIEVCKIYLSKLLPTAVRLNKEVVCVDALDAHIMNLLTKEKGLNNLVFSSEASAINGLVLVAHEPIKDPRIGWITQSAPKFLNLVQLGVNLPTSETIVSCECGTDKFYQKRNPGALDESAFVQASGNLAGMTGVYQLLELLRMEKLSDEDFARQYAFSYPNARTLVFRGLVTYVIKITSLLLADAVNMRGLHIVIATDLPTLTAGLILKGLFNIPVFYDAHECWPEQDIDSSEPEKKFWRDMEKRLVACTDYNQTVSGTLADMMTNDYQQKFESLPNCLPLKDVPLTFDDKKISRANNTTQFLFQGGFAKARGIELLITTWPKTKKKAILLLRGPDNSYKQEMIALAQTSGLLNTRIFFPEAVHEEQLIEALSDGDVGLIPYAPVLANHTHCCPNKMSQYFAAKLPVLANNTQFVGKIITKAQAGVIVDFNNQQALVDAVDNFLDNSIDLISMGEAGYQYFLEQFNWEKVSRAFYQEIESITKQALPGKLNLFHTKGEALFEISGGVMRERSKPSVARTLWRRLPEKMRQRVKEIIASPISA